MSQINSEPSVKSVSSVDSFKKVTHMKPLLRFCFLLGFTGIFDICLMGAGQEPQTIVRQNWPKAYRASYGFEAIADHNGVIIVSSVDTTSQAYQLGVRPGMEILGWNTLPVKRKLSEMNVKKYRKNFPGLTEEQVRLALLCRGRPGDSAEVFFMTPTGNNRGLRISAK